MNSLSTTTSLLTHSLAWALLCSLWQGALIFITLYVLLKALPNANARIKYYLSLSAFTGLFLWFADTWLVQYQKLRGVTVFITQSATDGGVSKTFSINTFAGTAGHHTATSFLPGVEQYFPLLLIIYTLGLAFMLCRFVINILQVRGLRRSGLVEPGTEWTNLMGYWADRFEIERPVKLYLSNRVNIPMILGVLKPIILLPVAAVNHLTTEQVEAILMHELAHIKRHDYLLNIFQTIAETILFFNPFVWLISAIIRREREHCCDDMVVAGSASPLPYARALAILGSNSISNDNRLVLAAAGQKNQLFHRIKRIMEMKKNNVNYSQLTIIVVAILAITFSIAMFTFTPSFAQKAKHDAGDSTRTKSVYKYKSVKIDSNGKRTEVVKESDKPMKEEFRDDDNSVDVNITMNDDSDGKHTGKKTMAYSYSYSNNDDDANFVTTFAPLARITIDGIEKEMEAAQHELDGVDWGEIKAEIKKGLAEIDKELNDEKMNKEISIEVKKGLEKSKEALEKAEKELQKSQKLQVDVRTKAGKSKTIAIARTSDGEETGGTDFEVMLDKMEQDKLIDRSKSYSIAKKNGTLYINDEKQPESVLSKYGEYLKDKSISIKGNKGSLSISIDN